MTTYVWCPEQKKVVEKGEEHRAAGVTIIRDIDPYRAVASDVAAKGKRPVIGGRRQHREFLRRNGYTELGNEMPKREDYGPRKGEIGEVVRRILEG